MPTHTLNIVLKTKTVKQLDNTKSDFSNGVAFFVLYI
ncbi:hypothetical protein SAMN06265377_0349 [Flagellimonas pacifica]|uniref:Uncharacterized protein n=1 Tax=Flagellimonas pacifica TaxID=1247520 RepID=A0A285MC31_9FLAO|nr:hypothetical protein SAMN06265377_0349 [Allomuricauda parva]